MQAQAAAPPPALPASTPAPAPVAPVVAATAPRALGAQLDARVPLREMLQPRPAADSAPSFGMPPKLAACKSSVAEYVSTQEFIESMSRRFASTLPLLSEPAVADASVAA